MSHLSRIRRRLPRLSSTQAAAMAVVGVLCAVSVLTGLTGHTGTATATLAVLVGVTLTAVLLMFRRLAGAQRAGLAAQRDLRTTVEEMQRRLVAAVERERLTAGDRHLELAEAIARVKQVTDRKAASAQVLGLPREFEATVQLFQGFVPRAPMPSSGDFALNPTDLLELLHLIRVRQPRLVLELGSGTSSVWIAYVLEQAGGRLISLDHDIEYATRTRAVLAAHGLTDVAEVRHAPLTPVTIDDRDYPWYDPEALADLHDVDFVLIDGPPAATGPDARYPALHVIEKRLAERATLVFDDAGRKDEQAAIAAWTERYEGLTRESEILGRHAVLSFVRPPAMAVAPS
ncbi:O-methyltransferase [Actinoplanes aureus]|uniref:Class I SAM-dependent methyltransferase n=1 Tax=Actinoplanes aureus TaxID=2792083 RepID=A0A931C637_9ACTN|nr:class I SAM-dependent methyltransferase [Actinoplanes aureus]MBG0562052.1 class I SAM-dependent methyltransferase [Actinoplanes aureus]